MTWSTGKKLSLASHQPYLGEGLYKGLVSLSSDMVTREKFRTNSSQSYFGEGLYKGLISLSGDVDPGEEVENNPPYSLTLVKICTKVLYIAQRRHGHREEVENNLTL